MIRISLTFLAIAASAVPAMARPFSEEPRTLNPIYATMPNLVGEVTATTDTITFENGDTLGLELVDDQALGGWGYGDPNKVSKAQVFATDGEVGPLEEGHLICQGAEITHMVAVSQGIWDAQLLFYSTEQSPAKNPDQGLCDAYYFEPETKIPLETFETTGFDTGTHHVGAWTVEVTSDPIDDSVKVISEIDAQRAVGSTGRPITLVFRCWGGEMNTFIDWQSSIQSSHHMVADVIHRFDSDEPGNLQWYYESGSPFTSLHYGSSDFMKGVLSSDKLAVRTTVRTSQEQTAVFDLTDAYQPVQAVASTCGYLVSAKTE